MEERLAIMAYILIYNNIVCLKYITNHSVIIPTVQYNIIIII